MRNSLAVLVAACLSTAAIAAPLPPAPPYAAEILKDIRDARTARAIGKVSDRLAETVTLTVNGKQVATGKAKVAELLANDMRYIAYSPGGVALSADAVMTWDSVVNSNPDPKAKIADCCRWARATVFEVDGSQKIWNIAIVENTGGNWEAPEPKAQ